MRTSRRCASSTSIAVEPAEVDHDAAVVRAAAADSVTAAADRERGIRMPSARRRPRRRPARASRAAARCRARRRAGRWSARRRSRSRPARSRAVPRGRRRTRCRRAAPPARSPTGRSPRRSRARARSRATSSRTAGATSSPKLRSSARVVAREDEGADAVLEREPGQLLGELPRVGVELPDVEQAPDLTRVAARRTRPPRRSRRCRGRDRRASCSRARAASRRPCAR